MLSDCELAGLVLDDRREREGSIDDATRFNRSASGADVTGQASA